MSNIVYIRRLNTSRSDLLHADAKKKIGATITASGDIRTGLTLEEEKKIMPQIVHISPEDFSFRPRVQDYFKNLTLVIPPSYGSEDDGLKLEIGLENGVPINPIDYVKYKFAIANPTVTSDESGIRNGNTKYIIIDPKKKLQKDAQELDYRKKAYKEYIKLCENEGKLNMVCSILSDEIGVVNAKKTAKEVKEINLEKFVQRSPDRFMSIVLDGDLPIKSFIEECIRFNVLKKIGTAVINGNEQIGGSIEEAVFYLKDKANSDVYVMLKAKLDEFTKT